MSFLRSLFCAFLLMAATGLMAHAEGNGALAGDWIIRVTDEENPSFSGTARVTYDTETEAYTAHLITQDTCCDGQNYAKVRQTGQLQFEDGMIILTPEINEFLVREEGLPHITYAPDNFELRRVDAKTLSGKLNTFTEVVWTKELQAIS